MGFLSENNEIIGFDIDLAKEVFADKKVIFQPIDWDAKELELNSGKIDAIWNGMYQTDDNGLDIQKQNLKKYPATRGYEIFEVIREIDSGTNLNRTGINNIYEAIDGNKRVYPK